MVSMMLTFVMLLILLNLYDYIRGYVERSIKATTKVDQGRNVASLHPSWMLKSSPKVVVWCFHEVWLVSWVFRSEGYLQCYKSFGIWTWLLKRYRLRNHPIIKRSRGKPFLSAGNWTIYRGLMSGNQVWLKIKMFSRYWESRDWKCLVCFYRRTKSSSFDQSDLRGFSCCYGLWTNVYVIYI